MTGNVQNDKFWKVLSVVLIVLLIGAVAVTVWQVQQSPKHVYYQRMSQPATSDMVALAPGLEVDHSSIYWVADLAEQALPFVVNVETIIEFDEDSDDKVKDMLEEMHENIPDFFKNNPGIQEWQYQTPDEPMVGGEGSGFIIREDGYIVTNAHVVEGASKFLVHFYDGTSHEAKLIGTDAFKDIAVLKIDTDEDLPVAVLGDSDTLRIGEPVVAIGSPLGFDATVTSGIVSTARRNVEDLGRHSDSRRPTGLIQTDAAINRGNSGGPLLNADGEVIGVNQAIIRWENSAMYTMDRVPVEGIGFAIPINDIKGTIEQIVKEGKVVYPGISATITTFSDYIKREGLEVDKLGVEEGVYVQSLTVGGPADRAGIEAGDVIMSINDVDLLTADQLIDEIQKHQVGERVTMRVARQAGEKHEDVVVVLGELDLSGFAIE